jgi:hypothetical protein
MKKPKDKFGIKLDDRYWDGKKQHFVDSPTSATKYPSLEVAERCLSNVVRIHNSHVDEKHQITAKFLDARQIVW